MPRDTSRFSASLGLSGSVTTQTFPVVTDPSTAVTGTRTAPVAEPASMPMVIFRPAKTCCSAGTEQRTSTLVPSPVLVVVLPSWPVVVEVFSFVPIFRSVQEKGAGPSVVEMVAAAGASFFVVVSTFYLTILSLLFV